MTMVKMKVELQAFTTPNYVLAEIPVGSRQEGFSGGVKWHLSEVDADVLAALCDAFRKEIFEKAEKADPAKLDKSYHR